MCVHVCVYIYIFRHVCGDVCMHTCMYLCGCIYISMHHWCIQIPEAFGMIARRRGKVELLGSFVCGQPSGTPVGWDFVCLPLTCFRLFLHSSLNPFAKRVVLGSKSISNPFGKRCVLRPRVTPVCSIFPLCPQPDANRQPRLGKPRSRGT